MACITVRAIVEGVKPVLMASRDADDGGWQFHTGEETHAVEAKLVSLKSMVDRDSTLLQLASVQPGWIARRDCLGAPWALHAEGGTEV